MELAEYSVPKINAEEGDACGEGGLFFCAAKEGVRRAMELRAAGKVLLLSDGRAHALLAPFACHPRALSVVAETDDCLPLFSMPDGVTCVVAAGNASIMRAARFFAGTRGCLCALIPADYSLRGAFGAKGEVTVGGVKMRYPLAPARVFCDTSLSEISLARARCALALSRLSLFEARALRAFTHKEPGKGFDRAYRACMRPPARMSAEEVVRANAAVRRSENEGVSEGEGAFLSDVYADAGEEFPEWRAYRELSALYYAFFLRGKPRKYFVPDYRARCSEEEYARTDVPTAEEYARRAIALERMRGEMAREISAIVRDNAELPRLLRAASPEALLRGGDARALKGLPEKCPHGLSAIIRDFGLMEWE